MSIGDGSPYEGLLCAWCLQAMLVPTSTVECVDGRHDLRRITEVRDALGLGHKRFKINGNDGYSLRADTTFLGDAACIGHLHLSMHRLPYSHRWPG